MAERWLMGALGVWAVLAGVLVVGCKDDTQSVPTVAAPKGVKGPTKEQVLAKPEEAPKADWSDYDPIPPLGMPTAYKTPDGEMWERYKSGLMIQQLKPGNGPKAQLGQTVTVAYRGTFPTGKQFDESPKDKPLEFVVGKKNSVIKGWGMAVMTMRPGAKIKLFLPPDLAYGAVGSPPLIGPNSALVFEMELVKVRGDAVEIPSETQAATQDFGIPEIDALKHPVPAGPALPKGNGPLTMPGR